MEVNEMLDQAYKAVKIAQDNADTAREAIRQRDILQGALFSIYLGQCKDPKAVALEALRQTNAFVQ